MKPCRRPRRGWRNRCRTPARRCRSAMMLPLQYRWPQSQPEAANVVDDVPGQKRIPADRSQHDGQPFARAVIRGVARVLPEMPVDRQQPEADRGDVLLHLEHAEGFPQLFLLDQDAHVETVPSVYPGADDENEDPQHANSGGISWSRHRAKVRDETAGGAGTRRYEHGGRLVRERTEQCDRQQRMNDGQDGPERVDGNVVEHEIHQTSPNGNGGAIAFTRAAGISVRQRIGPELEMRCQRLGAFAAFDQPWRAIAVCSPQAAALPAGVRIVDAAV